jgi:monoamine oxidase
MIGRRRRRQRLRPRRCGPGEEIEEMTNVAIVGAGCAGLGAAATLLETTNANVWIFEALGRNGGRTWTYSGDLPVDLGAEAMEQPASNPWVEIATMLDFEMIDVSQTTLYRVFADGAWSSEGSTPGIELVDAVLQEGFTTRRGQPNLPIIGALRNWDDVSPQMVSLALSSNPFYGPIKESAEPWQYVAADMYRQQQLGPSDDVPPKFVKRGVGRLVSRFAAYLEETYPQRLKIRQNAPVAQVNGEDGNLMLATGDAILSDYCIVTVPVSTILQIAFTPPLPDDRVAAYGTLRLGSYKKVGFRPEVPPSDGDTIEPGTLYYVFDALLGGSWQYSWLPTDPTILLCAASGNFAAQLDGMTDDEVLTRLIELLTAAHPSGNFAPKPGADQQPEVAISNWTAQPGIHGAFSYTSYDGGVADDPRPLAARQLSAKPHGRAYFAGEACYFKNYGTIAGAYLSGAEAARLLKEERGLPGPDQ